MYVEDKKLVFSQLLQLQVYLSCAKVPKEVVTGQRFQADQLIGSSKMADQGRGSCGGKRTISFVSVISHVFLPVAPIRRLLK